MIEEVFAAMTAEQVIERLDAAQIANARQNEVADLIAHPQLAERDRWREVDTPVGPIAALRPPAILHGVGERFDPIPAVGEHTEAILRSLGHDAASIDQLRASGAI